jgi:hypothetical protein
MSVDPNAPVAYADPFSAGHGAIWRALLAWAPWTTRVRATGRIRTDLVDVTTLPPPPTDGNLPEVVVAQDAFDTGEVVARYEPFLVTQDYTLLITSDRLNFAEVNLLKWLTIQALKSRGVSLGSGCLIERWRLSGADAWRDKGRDPERPTGTYRATTVGRIRLWMRISQEQSEKPDQTFTF